MQSLVNDWNRGAYGRLLAIAGAVLGTFVLVLILARLATAPTMELLFARLDPAVAGRIVTELQSRGVAHEVRGDSIYVDGERRDSLRLELAGEGLPGADGAGYELLDGLSGFGTTSQMFDAAYWRAREGELARTILAGEGVSTARVHIATPGRSPFARDTDATASVTVGMKTGAVPPDLAESVQSLVAGAVRGLDADAVSVVDSRSGRVVSRDGGARDGAERADRLAEMRAAVDRLLTARVGPGRFVAEVNVDTTSDVEKLHETILDPDSRVVISTDSQESTSSDVGSGAQGVTIASNLPDGDGANAGGESRSNSAETRERVNYEVSERERQVTRAPGAVERVTVAVMVDGVTGEDGTWNPRPAAELDVIGELVSAAVGIREERGDVVTVRSLPFEAPPDAGVADASAPFLTGAQVVRLASVAALVLAAIALPALVVRPLLARREEATALPGAAPASAGLPAPEGLAEASGAGGGADDLPELPGLGDDGDLPALPAPDDGALEDLPFMTDAEEDEDPVERLRRLIGERRDETVDVLREWIGDDPEHAPHDGGR